MKRLLLAAALLLPVASAPAFAQADNDIAAKLSAGHNYSASHRAARARARALRRHPPMASTATPSASH